MRTLAQVIGAALIIMFGIHGMYQTILPEIVLDAAAGSSKRLETISRSASAPVIPFVKAVMTIDPARRTGDAGRTQPCVFPVSLERVTK